jgi:hypothetical protein
MTAETKHETGLANVASTDGANAIALLLHEHCLNYERLRAGAWTSQSGANQEYCRALEKANLSYQKAARDSYEKHSRIASDPESNLESRTEAYSKYVSELQSAQSDVWKNCENARKGLIEQTENIYSKACEARKDATNKLIEEVLRVLASLDKGSISSEALSALGQSLSTVGQCVSAMQL